MWTSLYGLAVLGTLFTGWQAQSCTPSAEPCFNNSMCCSEICLEDFCDGCSGEGVPCTERDQCCSFNCWGLQDGVDGVCEPGSDRCTYPGGRCMHDIDCCEGSRCRDDRCSDSSSVRPSWAFIVSTQTVIAAAAVTLARSQ